LRARYSAPVDRGESAQSVSARRPACGQVDEQLARKRTLLVDKFQNAALVAATCTALVESGWSERLYPLVLLFLWNGLKFFFFGPWSLVLLARVRAAGGFGCPYG
jgi:hypothetical protein